MKGTVFDHVTIRVSDRAASRVFYETVLGAAAIKGPTEWEAFTEWEDFSIAQARPDRQATKRLHIGFWAPSREAVDAFWRAGVDAGHRSDGEPGPRPEYSASYYGGFLLDPDQNSAEAVHHDPAEPAGNVDHLWIRVADLKRSRDFYELISEVAGFGLAADEPEWVHFRDLAGGSSFSLVPGEPTANLHLAFPAEENDTVDTFHEALTGAGHTDNGAPGERADYHPGYYSAFVLDPDGNNIEMVNHNFG